MASGAFIAVDWGTTNLRAWRLGLDGAVLQSAEFPFGVSRLALGEAATRFEAEVRPALGGEGLPALLCGMIGSTLGWIVAPYIDCPASPEILAAGLIEAAPGVRIVPGLRCAGLVGPDVMRGEETQILGWLAADPARARGRHLLCLPGTHSKWVQIEDGVVSRFVTAMTGELYALLGAQSVLRFGPDQDEDLEAFDRGAAAASDGGALSARLFGLRGLTLAGQVSAASAPSWLSGLLIGAEIAGLWPLMAGDSPGRIEFVGEPSLCALYSRAVGSKCSHFGTTVGQAAALDGLKVIWKAAA